MESTESDSFVPDLVGEMSESEMRRWIFRLKYCILRRRKSFLKTHSRKFMRCYSKRAFSTCLHFKVILGLAASAYLLTKDKDADTSVYLENFDPSSTCRLNNHDLKAVLRQRGVSTELFLERKDLETLIARTGPISVAELSTSLASEAALADFNLANSNDANFYEDIMSSGFLVPQNSQAETKFVIFDSPGLFVERIEESKENVWVLSVISSDPKAVHTVSPAIWARLIHKFSPLNVKFGVLLCSKLDSVCRDYGFTPSILVVSLPVSPLNRKLSVEFHRLSLAHAPVCNDLTPRGRNGCILLLDHVTNLLQNFMASRVTTFISPMQMMQNRLHTYGRPQPLNVIWVPGERFCNHTYPMKTLSHQLFIRPPLSFSILAVAFRGRAAFWRYDPTNEAISPNFPSSSGFLSDLGCAITDWDDSSRYIFVTPEGYCSVRKELSFQQLGSLLRWNYPSTNDLFIVGLIVLNTTLIVAALVQALVLFARFTTTSKLFPKSFKFPPFDNFSQKYRCGTNAPMSTLEFRAKLITDVVKVTFRGWKSYAPKLPTDPNNSVSPSPSRFQTIISMTQQVLNALLGLSWRLIWANSLFLLAALPAVNFFGHFLPLADFLLYLLRFFVYWFDLAQIAPNAFTMTLICKVVLLSLALIYVFSQALCWLACKISARVLHPRLQRSKKTDLFVARLFKMNCASVALASPALLARYLVLSDDEFSAESPQQSSSSISEGDSQAETQSACAAIRAKEMARLYRKTMELDRAFSAAAKRFDYSLNSSRQLLTHSDSSMANFPAKLYIWKFTGNSATVPIGRELSSHAVKRRSALSRHSADDGCEPDKFYEGGSESDGNLQYCSGLVEHRRQRKLRKMVVRSYPEEQQPEWPSWVILCDDCVVCWREFEPQAIMAALSCGHAFHAQCLRSWLNVGRHICPVCRWPAHLSHVQREKHLMHQLARTVRRGLRLAQSTTSNASSSSS